ncbi:Ribosomal RNA small subunit methyltransferase, chloroplastic [Linum perenne]
MSSWAPPRLHLSLPDHPLWVQRPRSWIPAFETGPNYSRSKRLDARCARVSQTSPDDYHATLRALNSRGRKPRKSLGQHYMLNNEINDQLAGAANVGEGDVVLEIGPGTGSLTNVLISSGATVLAVEKDPYMAALVKERFADTGRLKVVEEDFVKCNIGSHISLLLESLSATGDRPRFAKVVANIPFNISKDVVKQLLPMGDIFSEVVLLLQVY